MKIKLAIFMAWFVVVVFAISSSAIAQDTTNAAATLQQDVAQLQNSPDDQTLRSNIILFAATMKSPPAIPVEANRHFIMGNTLYHEAKIPSDYQLAASEYHQALLLAPWWGTVYSNEGLALQKAGQYDAAIADLNLYLLTHPTDAVDVTNQIYAIEAEKELAAKRAADAAQQQAQQAAAAEQQKEQQAKEEQQQEAEEQQQAEQQKQAAQEKARWVVGKWNLPVNGALTTQNGYSVQLVISYDGANYSASIVPNPWHAGDGSNITWLFAMKSFEVVGREVKFTVGEQYMNVNGNFYNYIYDLRPSADASELQGSLTVGATTLANGITIPNGSIHVFTMSREE